MSAQEVDWAHLNPNVYKLAQALFNAERTIHEFGLCLLEEAADPQYYIDRAKCIVETHWYQDMLEYAWRYSDLCD